MNIGTVVTALFIALAFVTWPIVGKYSGAVGGWVGTMSSVGTLTAVSVLSSRMLATPPPIRIVAILVGAGVINGIGLYVYSQRTTDPSGPTSAFVVMTSTMMVVWAPLLDRLLNGTVFNPNQILGFGAAALAIYLLGR